MALPWICISFRFLAFSTFCRALLACRWSDHRITVTRRYLTLEGFERAEAAFFADGASLSDALASSGGSSSEECTWAFYMDASLSDQVDRTTYVRTDCRFRVPAFAVPPAFSFLAALR